MNGAIITVMGHEANIEHIGSRLALPPWQEHDELVVWLSFKEAVDGTLAFGVGLPAREYSREEFLQAVKEVAEKQLANIIARDKQEKARRAREEERKRTLDDLAGRLRSMVG